MRGDPTPVGTQRRLQALMSRSWSLQAIARAEGLRAPQLARALENPRTITPKLAAQVRRAYDRLWNADPPGATPEQRELADAAADAARSRGWAPPLAWDDAQIDKPDGQPVTDWRRSNRVTLRSADLAEDADFVRRVAATQPPTWPPSRRASASAGHDWRKPSADSGLRKIAATIWRPGDHGASCPLLSTDPWPSHDRRAFHSQALASTDQGRLEVPDSSDVCRRLLEADNLAEVLDAAYDAFDTILWLIHSYRDIGAPFYAALVIAAPAAADGRAAVTAAPSLRAPGRRRPLRGPASDSPSEVVAALGVLSRNLSSRLRWALCAADVPADNRACEDASQYADEIVALVTGYWP
jgi:hypothetical protein